MSEERAAYLLAMATEVRAAARDMRFPEARNEMSELAARFERMARNPADDDDEELLLQGVFAGWAKRRWAMS